MGHLLRRVLRKDAGDSGPARARPAPDAAAPTAEARRRLADVHRAINGRYLSEPDLRALPEVAALLDGPDDVRAAALMEVVAGRLGGAMDPGTWSLVTMLGRRKLVVPAWQLGPLLYDVDDMLRGNDRWKASSILDQLSGIIERSVGELAGPERAVANEQVARILAIAEADNRVRLSPVTMKRLRAVLPSQGGLVLDPIATDDGVGLAFRAVLTASDEPVDALAPFVAHLLAPTKGRPSATWTSKTVKLAASLRDPKAMLRALLQAALDADDQPIRYDHGTSVYETERWVAPNNEPTVRNVVWASAAVKDADAIPLLRALSLKTVVVIGGQFGYPRSLSVALACPGAIAAIGAPASLTALQGLQRSTRHGTLLKETGKAIDSLAAAANVSRSELLETAVERHDLDDAGRRELAVGGWVASLQVTGAGDVETTWIDPDGTARPSLPKAVRDAEPAAATQVKTATKAMRDTIAAERARLDRLFVENRRWSVVEWRSRYLKHPITGALSRSLIWRFGTVTGMPTADGTAVTGPDGGTSPIADDVDVTLWHPIQATEGEVQAWREWLMAQRLAQPLKQAFREVYLVTPAEVATDTYSNRFASHVIRQVQARALMKGRGWAPVAVAWWDDGIDHGVARRSLDSFGVRVEFFYDPIDDIQPATTNLYAYCTTDQVRFFRAGTDEALHVAEVPPVAFSELMRDVDLFVGVTSIGADPQWLDRGERRFDTYWQRWGFGDLGQPASIRRDVIARLLPALRIADRSRLTDRYLEVDGTLHTYRIHLGSGNILMSPNDRYLCIVAARNPGDDRLFLPFEDDPMLGLILSKAFLLVDDTSITDPTIVRQLKGD